MPRLELPWCFAASIFHQWNRLLAHLSSDESVRSERERAALAVVGDGRSDAGRGLAATGRSTYLYWLPCRGSMLRGSFINYYVDVGRKFSPGCKQAMDGDVALVMPWTSGLNLVAMALLGVAWLTLVVGLR